MREQEWSNGKVALYGFSRGAELDAVIAHSPSDLYNSFWN